MLNIHNLDMLKTQILDMLKTKTLDTLKKKKNRDVVDAQNIPFKGA